MYHAQESALSAQEKAVKTLREELAVYKNQETSLSAENETLTGELSEFKLQLERIVFEAKESAITNDALKEQNVDLAAELEEARVRSSCLIPFCCR